MKICLVSLAALPYHVAGAPGAHGGAEAHTTLLAQGLSARGHEVTILLADYDESTPRERRTSDLRLVNAYHRRTGLPGLRFLPRWAAFHRALGRVPAEVVFQMGASAATGQVALACRRAGRAFVFATASDSDVHPRRLRLGARDRALFAYGLRRAQRIVTQHEGQTETLRSAWGLPGAALPSAVALPERVLPPGEPPVVLWLGTLRSVKHPQRWLALADRFPAARFVMIGGASATEPEVYAAARRDAERSPNVTFLGSLPTAEPHLAAAWVLLNTSSVEGFPTTFLEAWSRGVPSVSLVDPGGIIARHGLGRVAADNEGLATALGEVLGSRSLRDALGARGREYVTAHHAPDRVAAGFEAVFREAIDALRSR